MICDTVVGFFIGIRYGIVENPVQPRTCGFVCGPMLQPVNDKNMFHHICISKKKSNFAA